MLTGNPAAVRDPIEQPSFVKNWKLVYFITLETEPERLKARLHCLHYVAFYFVECYKIDRSCDKVAR